MREWKTSQINGSPMDRLLLQSCAYVRGEVVMTNEAEKTRSTVGRWGVLCPVEVCVKSVWESERASEGECQREESARAEE